MAQGARGRGAGGGGGFPGGPPPAVPAAWGARRGDPWGTRVSGRADRRPPRTRRDPEEVTGREETGSSGGSSGKMEKYPKERSRGTENEMNPPLLAALQEDGSVDPAPDPALPNEDLLFLFRKMLILRALDEKAISLQRSGRTGCFVPSTGQEASEIGSA